MSSIRILSDRVANQIAAGEVIERPVAVVKELVENSIDAGATRIEVEFRNGGKSYIRIEDNGKGMTPDEALIALERHATSKIREAADLNEINSFGFRGEALPSIASVSKFTLRTRAEGWEFGTEIVINGGKLVDKKACGMPVGTVIEVAHLFNSVPARRKFLKTEATETAHITYTTRLFAVAHPRIAFRLMENGRTLFQSPACDHLRDRIAEIWGRQLANDLMVVDTTDTSRGYRLSGLTARPGVGRSTRRELVTLVNRRPVDSRTLGYAVLDAYHGRIQKGRYPPAFLFLEVDPQEVDVNVHPAKREVRFRDDAAVRRFVLGAVNDALASANKEFNTTQPLGVKLNTTEMEATTSKIQVSKSTLAQPKSSLTQGDAPAILPRASLPSERLADDSPSATLPVQPATPPRPKVGLASGSAVMADLKWRLISIFKKRYALFETSRGLVMLHIRHADQRVRFERIQKTFHATEIASQSLLIPHPIELEPLAADALKKHLKLLNSHGFSIEEFGRNFYRIESVPAWLEPTQVEDFLRDLIDLLRQREGSRKNDAMLWDSVAQLAIQGSYQSNDTLSEREIEVLAQSLLCCDTPHTSPKGKPTFSEVSWNEWARRLGAD